MTEPDTNTSSAEQRRFEARQTARREAFRLARDTGAPIIERPMYSRDKEPTVRDVQPLAGARAARDLESAAEGTARDYIRQARQPGHGWDRIGEAPGLGPGRGGAVEKDRLAPGPRYRDRHQPAATRTRSRPPPLPAGSTPSRPATPPPGNPQPSSNQRPSHEPPPAPAAAARRRHHRPRRGSGRRQRNTRRRAHPGRAAARRPRHPPPP